MLHGVQIGAIVSTYDHSNTVNDSIYDLNCYGFVNHLIKEQSDAAYNSLLVRMEALHPGIPKSIDGMPCPFNLYAIFQSLYTKPLEHWQPVMLNEIRPGDILVYQPVNYEPTKTPDYTKPSGTHTMIVQEIIRNENYLQVNVIDNTKIPRNKSDSRFPDNSGIGARPVFIRTISNSNGHRLGWRKKHLGLQKELIAGRIAD